MINFKLGASPRQEIMGNPPLPGIIFPRGRGVKPDYIFKVNIYIYGQPHGSQARVINFKMGASPREEVMGNPPLPGIIFPKGEGVTPTIYLKHIYVIP